MERLLVLKLDAVDCEAEASLNGVPLARVDAARTVRDRADPRVHGGRTEPTEARDLAAAGADARDVRRCRRRPDVADGKRMVQLRILLPRIGSMADESTARTLAQLDWAPPEGEGYEAPLTLDRGLRLAGQLPALALARGAAIDDTPTLRAQALKVVQELGQDLADRKARALPRGNAAAHRRNRGGLSASPR